MMANYISTILLLLIYFLTVYSYNNGIGEKPLRGWSSWYSYSSNISEYLIKNNTLELINSGLSKAGYNYINVDEGWIFNRSQNGTLISDATKFPNGMYNLGEFIHSHGLKYGLYSSRGKVQCSTTSYHAPGSYGYYEQDAEYIAYNNADYFKLDSCGAVGNMTDAFNQYNEFGTYLNKTNRIIYYDLCGWHWYFASVGSNFSNSWRVDGDDSNWNNVVNTFEIAYSGMQKYGNPYGWNNMDFLYSENKNSTYSMGKQTETQARAQFSIYALASSNLIISNAIAYLSDYDIETYTNIELINANQDIGPQNGPSSGFKIYGISAQNDISIFGKMLSDGSYIAAFLNTKNKSMDIICNSSCSVQMGFNNTVKQVKVYDVWDKKDLGILSLKNVLTGYKAFNGVLEMGMCTGSNDQIWEYYKDTKIIKSKYNNGILGAGFSHMCNGNEQLPLITIYDYD
eukprot:352998_1